MLMSITYVFKGNSDTYSSTKWTGPELVNVFALNAVLTPSSTIDFTNACERAVIINSQTREAERMGKTSPLVPSLTNDVIRKLEKIVFALKMAGSQEFANDYRAIVKQVPLGVSMNDTKIGLIYQFSGVQYFYRKSIII